MESLPTSEQLRHADDGARFSRAKATALAHSRAVGRQALIEEALRIAERYASEVVEALELCPWAKPSRLSGTLCRRVLLADKLGGEVHRQTLEVIEEFAADESLEVALVIFPLLEVDRISFRKFVSSLEAAHSEAHDGRNIPVGMAAFHSDAAADLRSPTKLIDFLRRSPDPTIQLVRLSSLAAARETSDEGSGYAGGIAALQAIRGGREPRQSITEKIAAANLATIESVGVARVEAILDDIARDRAKSYAAALASQDNE